MASLIEENRWVGFEKTEPIPIDLSPVIDPLQNFLELLNGILNVTLEILEFVEAFITSLLDPILNLLKLIIKTLKEILLDLDKLGIYWAGDFDLVKTGDFDGLKGGYAGYQQRMVERWLKDDPKKPDFKASGAVAIYLYASTNFIEGISPIVKAIELILRLFNQDPTSKGTALPSVGSLTVEVNDDVGFFEEIGLNEKSIELTFAVHTPPRESSISPNVGGFLIEMSTFEDGLLMGYSENVSNTKNDPNGTTVKRQGLYKIKGGFSNARWYSGTFEPEADPILSRENFFLRNPMDTARIDPSSVEGSGRHVFVKTYGFALEQQTHTINIPFSKLPKGYNILPDGSVEESDSKKVFFRVTAISKENADAIAKVEGLNIFKTEAYDVPLKLVHGSSDNGISTHRISLNIHSETFDPIYSESKATQGIYENEQMVLDTFKQALAVAYLTEFLYYYPDDIPEAENIQATYRDIGAKVERYLIESMPKHQKAYELKSVNTWRQAILSLIENRATVLKEETPPTLLPVIETYEKLREANLLDTFYVGEDREDMGLFINYKQPYRYNDESDIILAASVDERFEGMAIQKDIFILTNTKEERNSLIFTKNAFDNRQLFNRDVRWLDFKWAAKELIWSVDPEIVKQAFEVLSLYFPSTTATGEWGNIRFLENGIPPLEKFLRTTIKTLEDIEEALEGFGEKIKKAIALIEDKILQIQAIILLIDRVLERLKNFEISFEIPLDLLVHIGSGNAELVTQLLSSSDKPQDNRDAYTFGIVLVAGGIPTVLLELLSGLFVPEEE